MLTELNTIVEQQYKTTKGIAEDITQLLNYSDTN